jgi:hypothetical protein
VPEAPAVSVPQGELSDPELSVPELSVANTSDVHITLGAREARVCSPATASSLPEKAEASEPFHWDLESRSAAHLGKGKLGVGARAYALHPTTSVLCVGYARGNGPIETWIPGQPVPETALAAAADPNCFWVAHNAAFERAMLEHILAPLHGWPMVPVDRHLCTMSLAHAYPGSLESVAEVLGLANRKDVARERLVRVMWKPRKPRHGEDPNGIYWVDTPELRNELYLYNKQDIATERELHQHPILTPLPASEQAAWALDAEINDHGVTIDASLAEPAFRLAARALADLNERMRRETGGEVDAATKDKKLKEWLTTQGVKLPNKLSKGKLRPSLDAKISRSCWPETSRIPACVLRWRSDSRRRNRRPPRSGACCTAAAPTAGCATSTSFTGQPRDDGRAKDFSHRT